MISGVLFGIFVSLVWGVYALISQNYSCVSDIMRKFIYTGIIGTIFGMVFGFIFYIFDSFRKQSIH